jgi:acetyltransferase-like isoleucine patch superfamily enzyme
MADVGPNAVVGAGAVVTKPLPGWVVAAGVPARVVRVREGAPQPQPEADELGLVAKRVADA